MEERNGGSLLRFKKVGKSILRAVVYVCTHNVYIFAETFTVNSKYVVNYFTETFSERDIQRKESLGVNILLPRNLVIVDMFIAPSSSSLSLNLHLLLSSQIAFCKASYFLRFSCKM